MLILSLLFFCDGLPHINAARRTFMVHQVMQFTAFFRRHIIVRLKRIKRLPHMRWCVAFQTIFQLIKCKDKLPYLPFYHIHDNHMLIYLLVLYHMRKIFR